MKLTELFRVLTLPLNGDGKIFNALTLEEYPFSKIAVNNFGFPVLLISSKIDNTFLSQKNVRLKYLELTHNLECRITEKRKTNFANFTVIIFKSDELNLQNYFLGIAETLLKELSSNPTQKEIFNTFQGFVEIFRSLSNPPNRTIQGLWSELFVIENSNNAEVLLKYWHDYPEEKFDFNNDIEKLEVKSSSNMERVHVFTSEQLNPPNSKNVLIASLFTKQTNKGRCISDLIESIQNKVNDKILLEKLFSIISNTLGNTVEQGIKIKFDYDLAKNSLCYFNILDISKIEKINIPNRVSDVKYKSDLTSLKPVIPSNIKSDGEIFKSL